MGGGDRASFGVKGLNMSQLTCKNGLRISAVDESLSLSFSGSAVKKEGEKNSTKPVHRLNFYLRRSFSGIFNW